MKSFQTLNQILAATLALLMAVMTLDVIWGVASRYLLGHQSAWTEELARFLLIWIGILGAAYVAGLNQHLAIDLLPEKLEGRNRRRLDRLIRVLILLFAVGVMVVGGARYSWLTWKLGQTSPALQLPMWIVYIVMPISGLLVTLYQIAELSRKA